MIDCAELNRLIDLIDSEMTKIKDKILEIDKVVIQVDSKTKNSGLLGLESKKVSLLREYDLLLTRYSRLVEQRRYILDTYICDLCKNDTVFYTDDNRTIKI